MKEIPTIFRFKELADLDAVSMELLKIGKDSPVWLFHGQMGVGKTTLIKSLCKQLGVRTVVQSPTFALVNEYLSESQQTIYHFDFYRIKHETEALDMGIEEYFDSGNYCFVEWPDKIDSLWPLKYMDININLEENGERCLEIRQGG